MRRGYPALIVALCVACQGKITGGAEEQVRGPVAPDAGTIAPGMTGPDAGSGRQTDVHATTLALMNSEAVRCAGCHDNERLNLKTGSLEEFAARLVNQASGSEACAGELLVDPDQPERSLLLKLINAGRTEASCIAKMPLGSNGVAPEHFETFKAWVDRLIVAYRQNGGMNNGGPNEPPVTSDRAQPADVFAVLRKAKYLIAGTAVTAEELAAARDPQGGLNQSAFQTLVREWLASPDFDTKRWSFFRLALQQNPADSNYRQQLRNSVGIEAAPIIQNLEDSLVRTAERIYQNEEDFRSLIWTNRLEVTTATLIVLKMTDNPRMIGRLGNFEKNNGINNLRTILSTNYNGRSDPLYQNDISDWRTVELQYAPDSTDMQTTDGFEGGTNLTRLRSVAAGDTVRLRTPRTICSSPAFFQMWQTNEDNRFRAQVNQCLILALGSTFATGDPTTPDVHPFPGVRTSEVPEGSECMGCHKNLDPMVSSFEAHFDYENQRFRPNSQASVDHYIAEAARALNYDPDAQGRGPRYFYETFPAPYFSYQGVNEPGEDLFSFLRSVAMHPDYAIGWARKVCQWASSIPCKRQDPEMVRVAEAFKASGYRLDKLFEAFFTSKLITHTYADADNDYPGAQVSVSRRAHYCHALNVRLREARRVQGRSNVDSNTDLCASNRKLSEGIPEGAALRGSTDFNLPRSNSPFSSISVANLCSSKIDRVVGSGSRTFRRNDSEAEQTIGVMVAQVLGFPEGTPQHADAAEGLNKVYSVFRGTLPTCSDKAAFEAALSTDEPTCGLGLSEQAAMENIFSLVCQNPALTTLGL